MTKEGPASPPRAPPVSPGERGSVSPHPQAMKALVEFTERFGNMLSRALLTVLYFGVLGPFAIFYRFLADPLHLRRQPAGNWVKWVEHNDTLQAARRQD